MKRIYRYILCCLVFTTSYAAAQSFVTKVSAKTIGRKDALEVQYVAENIELSEFVLPAFKGWSIQSGPNFSSNRVQSGNQVKQQIVYSFILMPLRSGKLSVPSATITIDHHNSRQSNTVTVDVKDIDHIGSNAVTPPPSPGLFDDPPARENDFLKEQVIRRGENILQKINNNLLIKLDVNKTSCFVGEPILATYKLCTRLRSQSRVVKQPAFTGCTVTEMTTENPTPKHEMINGKMYNVYVIRKVQLTPLEAGELALPQASVENKVSFYKAESINFRDLYYEPSSAGVEQREITLSNRPVIISVKPLPAPAPVVFSGAVGKFRIAALTAADKPITTNSTSGLNIVIEGAGSLQQIKAPEVAWPQGLEGFDPTENEEIDKSNFPARVRKVFTYPFVVNKPGNFLISPIQFNYLDPATGKYVTASTEPVAFAAQKGSGNVISTITNRNVTDDFQTRLFILLGVGLIAVALGLLLFNRRQKPKPVVAAPFVAKEEPVILMPETRVDTNQYIQNIRDLNPVEDGKFYKLLQQNILGYLENKYNLQQNNLETFAATRNEAEQETLLKLKALINDCSLGMYTPVFTTEEGMQHRLQAIELLNRLEKNEPNYFR